jgi:precorrin-6B methylase 2
MSGDGKKTVCLGMPGYGQLTPGAARGFYTASHAHRLKLRCHESSLLAHNFNLLWCWALNEAKTGDGCDYFAMQHSDVEPGPGWLDALIDELEAKNLDVLGVVVPIKDVRGVTSTAVAREDGDPWRVKCRLTMSEVMRLPETFTSADVGGPLLLNTGLWVCRFDPVWTPKVHFTINDRIVEDSDGDYVCEVEPEDWYFSRLLHELGLKVGCTRKVPLTHRGVMAFTNTKAWGQNAFDREYLTKSTLDPDLPDEWFPHQAAGWLTEPEGRELARVAEGKTVLEVGSFCGRSTVCLARTAKAVTAVDTFDGRGTACEGDTLATFRKNLERYGVADRVTDIKGDSAAVLPDLPPVYDLIFIDGSHDFESVARDAELALGCLKPGGLLAFHDYQSGRGDEGVTRAVDDLLTGGAELLGRVDSLAVLRPAPTLTPVPVGV